LNPISIKMLAIITYWSLALLTMLQMPEITTVPLIPKSQPQSSQAFTNLAYSKVSGEELLLDLYVPEGMESPPLVVWIHGGAWRGGKKDNPEHALQLIKHGYAVASINYRLSQQAIFPAQIIDCKAAIRWLRAHQDQYKIDASRIGVWGSSAGGHLVALLGTSNGHSEWDQGGHLDQSSSVQAVCDWYGPTDFLRMDDVPGSMVHLSADSPESLLIGGDIRDHPEKTQLANPISYLDQHTSAIPPFLIMHGSADRTVIPGQSSLLHQAMLERNLNSKLIIVEGAGHGGPGFDDQVAPVRSFFDEYLK